MKKILLLTAVALPGLLWAQQENKKEREEAERIIITKKGADTEKLNIVVDGDNVTVNGQPIEEDQDGNITVKRLKIKDLNTFNWTPEVGFGEDGNAMNRQFQIMRAPNKAMLGVVTEKGEEGAIIKSVNEETGAAKAGLKEGDIITEVNSKKIEAPDQLSQALKDKKPGDKVTITYLRDGKKATTTAELTKWDAPQVMAFNGNGNMNFSAPDINLEDIMARIPRNLNDGNNRNFHLYNFNDARTPKMGIKIQDVEEGSGVKVIEVDENSEAEKAGIEEGDIIKEANGEAVSDTDDLLVEARKNRAGSSMKLKIDREGKPHDINILFPKKIKTADL
jgi:serine protease Do